MVWRALDSFMLRLRRDLGELSKGIVFYPHATALETPRAGTFPADTLWKSAVPSPPETQSYLGFQTGLQTGKLIAEQREKKINKAQKTPSST